jgi:hypothetical protein
MVSNLKSETARANGAKSRGPTTDEGKEKSSRNALKHGLTAGNGNILLDCEDRAQFDEVFNKLLGIHQPATPAETDILEEMVAARWRIRRMWTIETGLLNAEVLIQAAKIDIPDPDIHLASAFRSLTDDSRSLALASRYEARLQRLYDRAYKTLRELQQVRKSQEPTPPHTINYGWVDQKEEPDQPEPADAPSGHPSTETELPNEPSAEETVAQAFVPASRNAEPPTPRTGLRNEPTADANKEIVAEPTHPKSEIRNPKSNIHSEASPSEI